MGEDSCQLKCRCLVYPMRDQAVEKRASNPISRALAEHEAKSMHILSQEASSIEAKECILGSTRKRGISEQLDVAS